MKYVCLWNLTQDIFIQCLELRLIPNSLSGVTCQPLSNVTLPLCRSALQLTKNKCHVGSTEFVPTQCDLEVEKGLHSHFLLALILWKPKVSLQQSCKARMLPGAFVIIGRQLLSRPYSWLTPSKLQRCFIHTDLLSWGGNLPGQLTENSKHPSVLAVQSGGRSCSLGAGLIVWHKPFSKAIAGPW